jgi:hypothetical protein
MLKHTHTHTHTHTGSKQERKKERKNLLIFCERCCFVSGLILILIYLSENIKIKNLSEKY